MGGDRSDRVAEAPAPARHRHYRGGQAAVRRHPRGQLKNLTDEKKQINNIDFNMMRTANWKPPPRTFGLSLSYKW